MPLPPSIPREALHLRRIELQGYRRADGLYDVEARMTDTKTETLVIEGGKAIPPSEPIHDMWLRLVVDDDLNVIDVAASTDAAPFGVCPAAAGAMRGLKGVRIGPGWSKMIRDRLGGQQGCTHLRELLQPLATVAFQTLYDARKHKAAAVDGNGKPGKIDSCHAYAADGELVRMRWPEFSRQPQKPPA